MYLQLSEAFIGREIAALKNVDLEIDRYRLRCWDQSLVDDARKAEQHRTHVVLGVGGMDCCSRPCVLCIRTPRFGGKGHEWSGKSVADRNAGFPFNPSA